MLFIKIVVETKSTIANIIRYVGEKIALGISEIGVTFGVVAGLLLCGYGVGEDSIKVGEGLGEMFRGCDCLVVDDLGACENTWARSLAVIDVGVEVGVGEGIDVG